MADTGGMADTDTDADCSLQSCSNREPKWLEATCIADDVVADVVVAVVDVVVYFLLPGRFIPRGDIQEHHIQ